MDVRFSLEKDFNKLISSFFQIIFSPPLFL